MLLDESQGDKPTPLFSFASKEINMEKQNKKVEQLTGYSIIIMAVTAIVVMGMVFNHLLNEVSDANEAIVDKTLFTIGVGGWLVILLTDLIVSWGVYKVYYTKNKTKAILAGMMRLIYSVCLAVAVINLIRVIPMIGKDGTISSNAFDFIHRFKHIWQLGLIVFGVHLIFLSQLVCEKKIVLRIISVLLFVSGIGYLLDNTLIAIGGYEDLVARLEMVFMLPMILGEVWWAIRLIAKGK